MYEGGVTQDAIDQHVKNERRKAFQTEPHPDANGSLGSKIAKMNRESAMTDPNQKHKPWSDHEVETMAAIHGLTIQAPYKVDEVWYIKLEGASALTTVIITDVTDKTVAVRGYPYGTSARYIKTEVTFVEKASE